ncbi:DUF6153 family protein [Actinomycetospora rhizophila]|uniref:DUF6153 family protein n=1 Tax=Actinomycetospora rhizophila TaxID=1416876 RepID=A0ABV9Z7P1_9PSEU
MIRWHGRSHAVSARLLTSWSGRLALLAIAVGLVLMHHVVGAHQHTGEDSPQFGPAVPSVVTPGGTLQSADHDHGSAPGNGVASDPAMTHETQSGLPVESGAAFLHRHADGGGHDHSDSLLHMCLVALIGAAIFAFLLVLVASWWRMTPRAPIAPGHTSAAEPRAPPTSSRLAELQLLRL